MKDFNNYNKKFTEASSINLNIGKKVKLISPVSIYEIGSNFTVINDTDYDYELTLLGLGETFLQDELGKVVKINGSKNVIGNMFEEIIIPVVQDVKIEKKITRTIIEQIEGSQGIQGIKGDTGDKGFTGPMGPTGPIGEMGTNGKDGEQGIKGDTGEQGIKGDTGEQGIKGDTGEQGIKGDTGEQGIKGDKGDTGEQGIKGDKGDTGEQGLQGIQGLSGKDGSDGSQGIPGVLGEKGEQGIQGLQGISGKDGKDGKQGQKGISGVDGKDGIDGKKGDTGDSGILEVSYPLKINDKSLSIETQFLTDIVTNSSKGNTAQGGGGSNVAIYKDGERYINVVKSINFTGSGVTVTKDGNKLTVNINSSTSTEETPTEGAPTPNPPTINYITNLSLNTNGELVATYSNGEEITIGDVVELDQPLDGGTFN